jgi:DNA invertase Pin-like site-specific DNA recombinase
MNTKITEFHLSKPAYIYLRQSSPGQVRHHQQSTERQYGLREKALQLGWTEASIRVLDRDLGLSAKPYTAREDFKTLVADVSMGQVGAVFALEVSRLARSNVDWARLLELCALTRTVVLDDDGCYDPADFNDGLLLGLKGTMASAELHLLRSRLQGGKLHKAQKGELCFPLPVGLRYDDQRRIVMDPDEEVRGAVELVFKLFRESGSAYGVMHGFKQRGLRFPKRAYGGAWNGQLLWGRLTHSRVLGVLKNPSYAGRYVFGRYQYQRQISSEGRVHQHMRAVEMPQWRVHLPEHHEGFIGWEEFLKNQQRLASNRTNAQAAVLNGPAREGLALLQGLLLCGHCGHAVTMRYLGNGGVYPIYMCNWQRREAIATRDCLHVRCDRLDAAVSEAVLNVLKPAQMKLAVAALEEMQSRDEAVLRQWQMRVERAQYEAALAERRYQEADPSNRLVTSTLERRWNESLVALEETRKQYKAFEQKEARAVTAEQKAQILALAQNLPRLWHAKSTEPRDRKRMLRLLINDITVEREHRTYQAQLHIRWHGGACTNLTVDLPLPPAERVRYPQAIVERVRELALDLHDKQVAAQLNREGRRSAKGQRYNVSIVKWIRWRYNIPAAPIRTPDELTVQQLAQQMGVSIHVVYYWIDREIIQARKAHRGAPYAIKLDAAKARELRLWVKKSVKIRKS